MKTIIIAVEDAVGTPLSHDVTLIDPETGYKGARFRRGHHVTREDLPLLKRMGREHLSVLELEDDEVHEDEAALRLAARLEGPNFEVRGPSEGKCSLVARSGGFLSFDAEKIHEVNKDPCWVLATLPDRTPVAEGETVAAWRVVPLAVQAAAVERAERAVSSGAPLFSLAPFLPLKTALVTTGREIWDGRVRDAFREKLEKKLRLYDAPLVRQECVPDEESAIKNAIETCIAAGAEVVLCTGGMSVDADDLTPAAIERVATRVVFRGVPALPGSSLMLAQKGDVAILGVPACAVHATVTVLDTLMHRIYARQTLDGQEVRLWGVGGLCRGCPHCNYPACAFASRTP